MNLKYILVIIVSITILYLLKIKYNELFEIIKYEINNSKIHGKGLFAKKNLKKNELIDIAIILYNNDNYSITPFGRSINHCSHNYNTKLKKFSNNYYILANRNIKAGDELTINYDSKDIPDFIEGSKSYYKKC